MVALPTAQFGLGIVSSGGPTIHNRKCSKKENNYFPSIIEKLIN
jgi:hypothetical protein